MKTSKKTKLLFLRVVAIVVVICVVGALCFTSFYLADKYERRLENEEFQSIATRLKDAALESMSDKVRALESISALVSLACPLKAMWPNCTVPMKYYFNITDPLIEIAEFRTIGFTPIITSEQVAGFEEFAYNTYEKGGYPGIGLSTFGKGIYAVNESTGEHFHTTEPPALNNKHQILTPVMQLGHLAVNREAVMLNHYYHPNRIASIDLLIDCFLQNNGTANSDCVTVTDVIQLVVDPQFRPSLVMFIPVAAQDSTDTIVGMTYGTMNWDSALSNAVPEYVDGVVVVLSGGEFDHTFEIQNGIALISGAEDTHDFSYNDNAIHFDIPLFAGSINYKVSIYSSREFSKQHRTLLPVFVVVVTLGVISMMAFLLNNLRLKRHGEQRDLVENTKRLFVRFISHEIRTPMNIVHLGLKLIAREMIDYVTKYSTSTEEETRVLTEALRGWVTLIEEVEVSSDDAVMVLNDLLNYDKIALGGMTIEKLPVNLWEILSTTVRPFLVQARGCDVTVTVNMELQQEGMSREMRKELSQLVTIGDSIKITQVIRNILSNALKFTPSNGTVEVSAIYVPNGLSSIEPHRGEKDFSFTKTGSIRICVKDSGHGISMEDQKQLFKEGLQFRANQLQAGGGSGLGLWISKGVTELHDGTLTASSAGEGKGTTFVLELPVGTSQSLVEKIVNSTIRTIRATMRKVVPDDTCASYEERVDKSSSEDMVEQTITHVLCVDDSAPSRKLMVRTLQRRGYTCYQACDGVDCLKQMHSLHVQGILIDAVLMDYEMPNLNGPDATRELIKQGFSTLVIGITGNVLPEDIKTFIDSGAYDVLGKPFSIDKLEKIFGTYFGPSP